MIHGAVVYSPTNPEATTMVIHDNTIVWIGDRVASSGFANDVDYEIDLGEVFIAPGFVDAHVHLSATGLLANSVNLEGFSSAQECLERVHQHHQTNPDGVLFGHGWDDTHWLDRDKWTAESVHKLVDQRLFYLTRTDVHSALCSQDLFSEMPATVDGFSSTGILRKDAHHKARQRALRHITDRQLQESITNALKQAAEHGIVAVHECAGPDVSGSRDFAQVLALKDVANLPLVIPYWGDRDLDSLEMHSASGAAGDLSVDGSLGSRTAFLLEPYADDDSIGATYLSRDEISAHLVACTQKNIQAGFHVIGDAAMSEVIHGLLHAIDECGIESVRRCRHRIEHAEMISDADYEILQSAGVTLSMQPAFEDEWGSTYGMYCTRLGELRTRKMNNYAKASALGIPIAFGSDSPVTPIDPWRAIKAATTHRTPESRLTLRAAFAAHTRGGWRATFHDDCGVLTVGAPAHFAVWAVTGFTDQVSVGESWSTDPRSGTPPLPDLTTGRPKCQLTVRNGKAIFDRHGVWPND